MSLTLLSTEVAVPTLEFADQELGRLAEGSAVISVSVPAPIAEPEALLRLTSPALGMGFLWDPPAGPSFSGIGVAHRIEHRGSDRFARLRAAADALWPRLRTAVHPDVVLLPDRAPGAPALIPRLFGGLAFDVGSADAEPWSELADSCFTLPRYLYSRSGGSAVVTLSVAAREILRTADREARVDELDNVLRVLAEDLPEPVEAPLVRLEEPSLRGWIEQVEAIREAIADGRFEKIVAAGRTRVELLAPPSTVDVLRRLSRGLRASTRFAFCRADSAFLGATPERLITRRGRRIETEALAGSIGIGAEHAAQLLASRKDQREHRLVVDEILRRLRPLCHHLDVGTEPRVRELREVLHLHTPIVGHLREERHVLELVEELHPTPAVGGLPTADAMRWISDHEPGARGWYAAPVGWFDATGDGELAVALRACVLRGREACLYAGAGIVADSDPELEYVETELKKRSLLRALGV